MVDFSQPNPSPYIDPKPYSPVLQGLSLFGQNLPGPQFDQGGADPKVVPSKARNIHMHASLPGPVLPSYNTPPGMPPSPGIDKYLINHNLLRYLGPNGGPIQ